MSKQLMAEADSHCLFSKHWAKAFRCMQLFDYQELQKQAGLVTVNSNTEDIQCEVCKISWRTWEMNYIIQEVSRKHDIPDLFHGFYSYQAWFRILVAMQFLSQPEKNSLAVEKYKHCICKTQLAFIYCLADPHLLQEIPSCLWGEKPVGEQGKSPQQDVKVTCLQSEFKF